MFGQTLHIDLLEVKDVVGDKYVILNLVDAARKFQVCVPLKGKSCRDVTTAMDFSWLN